MKAAARIILLLLLGSCVDLDPTELVAVEAEPAGANCAEGGTRIDTGVDADGDGELDADEVDSTEYLCDDAGSAGAADTDGVGTSP
jgi:hypothetical protein